MFQGNHREPMYSKSGGFTEAAAPNPNLTKHPTNPLIQTGLEQNSSNNSSWHDFDGLERRNRLLDRFQGI